MLEGDIMSQPISFSLQPVDETGEVMQSGEAGAFVSGALSGVSGAVNINCSVDGNTVGELVVNSNGAFTVPLDLSGLSEGQYTLDVTADDASTNSTAAHEETFQVVCFAAGTRIRIARGEVAVEMLRVGDFAVTASGEHRPVKWLGHRTLDCRRHPRPREAMPVRVAAHAFGENHPARDLLLSPGHSVCVDVVGGVLIPIGRLVNGATIAQLDVDTVTYWHVELESHDILLAENLACESYIDCGTRTFFAESGVVVLGASPDAKVPTTKDYCRPFKPEGALVDMVRDRLCQRASDLSWRRRRASAR